MKWGAAAIAAALVTGAAFFAVGKPAPSAEFKHPDGPWRVWVGNTPEVFNGEWGHWITYNHRTFFKCEDKNITACGDFVGNMNWIHWTRVKERIDQHAKP